METTYQPLGQPGSNSRVVIVSEGGTACKKSRPWWPAQSLGVSRPAALAPPAPPARARASYSPLVYGQGNGESSADEGEGDEGEELSDLLGLLSKHPSTTGSDTTETPTTMDLAKSETCDSTMLNNLLCTLHGTAPGLQHPPAAAGHDWFQGGGSGGVHIIASGPIVAHTLVEDTETDDMPLVSKRARTPNVVVDFGEGALAAPTPSGGDSPASFVGLQPTAAPIVGMQLCGVVGAAPFFRPHPAWAMEAGCVLYVAVFLTQESRDVLLSMVPPLHPIVSADHMTLAYKPSILQLLDYPLGAQVELKIIGSAADSRAQAVAADPPAWLPPTTSVSTHVTISVAVGTKAVEAGHLIMDALQRTAVADPGGPKPSGAGAYQHFDEALPLVGRLGLKLAPAAGSPPEVDVFSIEELARSGCISIGSDNLELFYKKHAAVLGNQLLQQQPSPTSLLDMPMTSFSSTSSYSPLSSGVFNPVDPPAVQLPPVVQPMDTSCWGPDLAAAAGPSSPFAAPQHQLQFSSPATPYDDAAEHLLNNVAGDSAAEETASTGTGSSNEAVQFRSAVQIGDYVALRPYVPTAGGEKILQGYVREFACDEPFQGNGVMVVLDDNTIGFVTAVLDSCMPDAASRHQAAVQRANSKSSRSGKRSRSKANRGAAGAGTSATAAAAASPGNLAVVDAAAAGADVLSEWALSARDAAATASAGLGIRNAEDAQRDMQLWSEFDALQRQHGEALCNAILEGCSQDFVEAIALIKAQCAGSFSSGNDSSAAAATAQVLSAAAATPAAAAAEGPVEDLDLVQQLALSLGLSPVSAVQLSKLAPHVSAERCVELLQEHSGDVNKAADALLSADAGGSGSSAAAPVPSAAATDAGAGSGTSFSCPAGRAACALLGSKDADLVVSAQQLCVMYPGLQQDTAELLLQEHGGSLDEAARAVADMQTTELEARTAAAASSPIMPQVSLHKHQQEHLSEDDQMAMLAAMGLLNLDDPQTQLQMQMQQTQQTPAPTQQAPRPRSPPKSPALPAGPSNSATRHSPFARQQPQQQALYGSPPRYGAAGTFPQQQQGLFGFGDQEAKKAAKEAADKLYTKSKTLHSAAQVYMTAAQALLADGDMEGYKEKKAAADKARAESKAAFDEAQKLSWSANNKLQQTWQADLHGLGTSVALRKFVSQFEGLAAMDNPGGVLYQVITGKGKHSEDNVPKIKLGVLQYLEEKASQVLEETGRPWFVTWEIDPCNEGVLNVYIPGSDQGNSAVSEN